MKVILIISFILSMSSAFSKNICSKAMFRLATLNVTKKWKFKSETEELMAKVFDSSETNKRKFQELFVILKDARLEKRKSKVGDKINAIFQDLNDFEAKDRGDKATIIGVSANYQHGYRTPYLINRVMSRRGEYISPGMMEAKLNQWHHSEVIVYTYLMEEILQRTGKRKEVLYRASRILDRYRITPNFFGPYFDYLGNAQAAGAQWEIISRIPEAKRAQMISEVDARMRDRKNASLRAKGLKETDFDSDVENDALLHPLVDVDRIVIEYLKNAHLSKTEFVQLALKLQDQGLLSLLRNSNKPKFTYPVLIMLGLATATITTELSIPVPFDALLIDLIVETQDPTEKDALEDEVE